MIKRLIIAILASAALSPVNAQTSNEKIIGMYVHQGWSYNHPYAARTWTLEDWSDYLGGIRYLGYNSILIWPMLETMPDPLTPSDRRHLDKTRSIIDLAHRKFNMKVFVVLSPNIIAKDDKAAKYTYESRPLYGVDDYVDPADPIKFGKLMERREKLLSSLRETDGIFIIDSDPGGYPNSTNIEFASLLTAHRRMLDRLRPGIELYYWAWTGWESYGRFHATGKFKMGTQAEIQDALSLINREHIEPWGVATQWLGYGAKIDTSMRDRVLAYNYGAIEGDPAFPFTGYGQAAYDAGKLAGSRGVIGNALTHCVQLPNTFAFARGAMGLPAGKEDYLAFANQLIEGAGDEIVAGWEALQGADATRMNAAVKELDRLQQLHLKPGKLSGLLFGDPRRFIEDLVSQLRMAAALFDLRQVLSKSGPEMDRKGIGAFESFVDRVDDWHKRHGYNSYWYWPPMTEALKKIPSIHLAPFLTNEPWWEGGKGATPAERTADAYIKIQSYTPRLIDAMKATLAGLKNGEKSVVFMGNSITARWKQVDSDFFAGKPFINRGISGQTTAQMLGRFSKDVIGLNPSVVVIEGGTNDIAGLGGPVSIEAIFGNIVSMAKLAKAHGIKVILCSVLPVYDYACCPGMEPVPKIADLNRRLKQYAANNGAFYVDYYTALADERKGMKAQLSPDGVHPNKEGYRVMEPLIEKAIDQALRKIR
jgi:lysophospholipase L1-like esterase